jgi:hypothetical protein
MNSKLNISNSKNYNKCFEQFSEKIYFYNYIDLINEYLLNVIDNMMIQDELYLFFLIKRGIETINHCFIFLLTYTKNIDLTIYHCKKALYYYIEFISQISDISINNSYLQLNSKDATLFVYKKTIYEIDNLYRKNINITDEESIFINKIHILTTLFNSNIIYLLQKDKLKYEKKKKIIIYSIEKTLYLMNKLFHKNNVNNNIKKIELCLFLFNKLQNYNVENEKYINICGKFIRKLHKFNNIEQTKIIIQNKMYNAECIENIKQFTPLKFINWITG